MNANESCIEPINGYEVLNGCLVSSQRRGGATTQSSMVSRRSRLENLDGVQLPAKTNHDAIHLSRLSDIYRPLLGRNFSALGTIRAIVQRSQRI